MNFKNFIYSLIALCFMAPAISQAQTAAELTADLEQVYKNAAAVELSFSFSGQKCSMTIGPKSGSYKIVTTDEQFIGDGHTAWHVLSTKHQVLVDNISKNNQSVTATALLDFSANYDATTSATTNGNILTLTPRSAIAPIFKEAGDIHSLSFLLKGKGKSMHIVSITATSNDGDKKLGNLKIKTLKSAPSSLFTYTAPKGYTVTDLRD